MRDVWRFLQNIIFVPFRILLKTVKWAVALLMLVLLAYGGIQWLDYRSSAYAFAPSEKCDLRNRLFGDAPLPFTFSCIDAGVRTDSTYLNFIFFMANEDRPAPDRTGHGWMALAQVRNDSEKLMVTRFRVFGFWGNNVDTCPRSLIKAYVWVSPLLPVNAAAFIEKNYKAACMGGHLGNEGLEFHELPNGREVPPITDMAALKQIFNNVPSVMLAVAIDTEQFNNILFRVNQYAAIDYSLVLSDCTTMLYRLADSIGLYTPPRWLYPYPSSSVDAIRLMNIRRPKVNTIEGRQSF